MLEEKILYGFDDVTLIPHPITSLESRNEVEENINNLLWVAPMDTVIDPENAAFFQEKGVQVSSVRGMWKSMPLLPINITLTFNEAKDWILNKDNQLSQFLDEYKKTYGKYRILIDIANGHMKSLFFICKALKEKYGNQLELGTGNIANPNTYMDYGMINLDWIRVGIGAGSRCHTSSKTSIHYPIISLVDKMKKIKEDYNFKTKIIADGGLRDSSDIVKALAAGADGIMSGSIFNKTIESAGKKSMLNPKNSLEIPIRVMDNIMAEVYFKEGNPIEVEYRGMSTLEVQMKENGTHKNYEEGFSKKNKVKYTLDECLHEINYAVKSAFTYCDAKTLKVFQENAKLYLINNLNNHNRL